MLTIIATTVVIIIKSRELREQIKAMVSSESFKDVVNRKLDKAFLPSSFLNTFWGLSFSLSSLSSLFFTLGRLEGVEGGKGKKAKKKGKE